jgi:hypothetical protein
MIMASNGWQYTLDSQYVRADMKLNHEEMMSMVEDLDAMRQSVNLHDTGDMPAEIYHHIEQAELRVLTHMFGKVHAGTVMRHVVESVESISDILQYERESAEHDVIDVEPTGWACKRCDGPAPTGVGYKLNVAAIADIDSCMCGYSRMPQS